MSRVHAPTCADVHRGPTGCESYAFVFQLHTPADAAPKLPTEGVEARQLSTDILPCGRAQLRGAGTAAEVQRGLGADGGWRGHPRGLREAGRARGSGWRGRKARRGSG